VSRVEKERGKYIIKYDDMDESVEEDLNFSERQWSVIQ